MGPVSFLKVYHWPKSKGISYNIGFHGHPSSSIHLQAALNFHIDDIHVSKQLFLKILEEKSQPSCGNFVENMMICKRAEIRYAGNYWGLWLMRPKNPYAMKNFHPLPHRIHIYIPYMVQLRTNSPWKSTIHLGKYLSRGYYGYKPKIAQMQSFHCSGNLW